MTSHGLCPYCHCDLDGGVTACPGCGTVHHRDCWSENSGCAVIGCDFRVSGADVARPARPLPVVAPPAPPAPAAPVAVEPAPAPPAPAAAEPAPAPPPGGSVAGPPARTEVPAAAGLADLESPGLGTATAGRGQRRVKIAAVLGVLALAGGAAFAASGGGGTKDKPSAVRAGTPSASGSSAGGQSDQGGEETGATDGPSSTGPAIASTTTAPASPTSSTTSISTPTTTGSIPTSSPTSPISPTTTGPGPTTTTITVGPVNTTIDRAAPRLVSLSATPSVSPGATLTFSAHFTDDSGVSYVSLQARQNGAISDISWCNTGTHLTSGAVKDGTWTVSCQVPQAVNSGTYTVTPYAGDSLGNYLNTNGGPTDPTRATFTVTGGIDDHSAPGLISLSATPSVSPGSTLTITAHFTDQSGVSYVSLQARQDGATSDISWCNTGAHLTNGTITDGTWTLTCPVPQAVNSGTYTVTPYAGDSLGNYLNTNGGPTDPTRATFTVTGGISDHEAPHLVSLSATPSVSPGDTLTFTAHFTDQSGVTYISLQARQDGATSDISWCNTGAQLVSGTITDGTWKVTCVVPGGVNAGTYTVTPYAGDSLGNYLNTNGGPTDPTRATFTVS